MLGNVGSCGGSDKCSVDVGVFAVVGEGDGGSSDSGCLGVMPALVLLSLNVGICK